MLTDSQWALAVQWWAELALTNPRCDRGVGTPEPLGDDCQWHIAQVQRGPAEVPGASTIQFE